MRSGRRYSASTAGWPTPTSNGRIVIAGDAGHIQSRVGGQGMNPGSATRRTWPGNSRGACRGRADGRCSTPTKPSAGRWRPESSKRHKTIPESCSAKARWGGLLRDRVLAPITRLPSVQRWATRAASQLWVNYRRGPLGSTGSSLAEAPPRRPRGRHRMRTQRMAVPPRCTPNSADTGQCWCQIMATPRALQRRRGEGAGAQRRHSRPHPAQHGRRHAGATRRPPRLARPLGQRRTTELRAGKRTASTGVHR